MNESRAAITTGRWKPFAIGCPIVAMLIAALGLWLYSKIVEAREAARQSNCKGHLGQIALAMHNYHDTYGSFPPAWIADEQGKPVHSWRVLLLPFLDQQALYEQYRFDEPWNGPNNQRLADQLRTGIYQCPSGPELRHTPTTDYVVITGARTAFPEREMTKLSDFVDGEANTILVAEVAHSRIHWMEPRDLDVNDMAFAIDDPKRPSISSVHANGPAVVFADGIRAYRIHPSVSPRSLEALSTVAGGERVTREKLERLDPVRGLFLAE